MRHSSFRIPAVLLMWSLTLFAVASSGCSCCPSACPCPCTSEGFVDSRAATPAAPGAHGVEAATLDQLLLALPAPTRGKAAVSPGRKKRPAQRPPALAGVSTEAIATEARKRQKVVYGVDDRRAIQDVTDPTIRERARGVVALFKASDVRDDPDGTSRLATSEFRLEYDLCPNEPFAAQGTGAFCSGFLVAPDVIATAGHCLTSDTVAQSTRFVFGFVQSGASTVTRVPTSDVYRGVRLLGRDEIATGADWALVQLDRPVTGRPVLALRRSGRIADQSSLYVIGHPCGLPTVFAGGAAVRSNAPSAFFVANLDTYGGNSGSPVFNAVTHEVEGILVRGETDFREVNGCNQSLLCPTTGCRGEDCTRVSEFLHLLP